MKRLSALLLALLILACGAARAKPYDVSGTWYGSILGIPAVLTLNEDGTYFWDDGLDMLDSLIGIEPGTWTYDTGVVILRFDEFEGEVHLLLINGELFLQNRDIGYKYVFTREPPAPQAFYEPAAEREAARSEEFEGEWRSILMVMDAEGMLEPVMASLDMSLSISGAAVRIGIYNLTDDLTASFENGRLIARLPAESETEYVTEQIITMTMLEDGMLHLAISYDSPDAEAFILPDVDFYLERLPDET